MKLPRGKRVVLPLLGVVVVLTFAFGFLRSSQPWIPEGWTAPLTPPPAHAQGTEGNELHGWAWSSNIGWVSFNAEDPVSAIDYKVDFNPATGALTGYAWSNNIGWVQFDPAGPYPSAGPNYSARMIEGVLTGWARAISPRDLPGSNGWDGWIKLGKTSGEPAYGITVDTTDGRSLKGYSWGSTVVGWLQFGLGIGDTTVCPQGGVCLPPLDTTPSLVCTPPVAPGTLTWSADVVNGGGTLWDFTWNTAAGTQNAIHSEYTSLTQGVVGTTHPMTVAAKENIRGTVLTKYCPATISALPTLTVKVIHNSGATGTVTDTSGSISGCNLETGCSESLLEGSNVNLHINNLTLGAPIQWALSYGISGETCDENTSSCTFAMPPTDAVVTVTIGTLANCPASIKCTRQSPGSYSCLAGASGGEHPIILDATPQSSSQIFTLPSAKIEVLNADGAPVQNANLSLSFTGTTISSSICTAGVSVSGRHLFSSTATGFPSLSSLLAAPNSGVTNGDQYSLSTTGVGYYRMFLPVSGANDIAYKCLPNGRKIVHIEASAQSCQAVSQDIVVDYRTAETSQ